MPIMATGKEVDSSFYLDQIGDSRDFVDSFQGGFGNIFGGLGYAGSLLGYLFLNLFEQAYKDFDAREMLPGVYVFSVFNETTTPVKTNDYGAGDVEYYILPTDYKLAAGLPIDSTVYCEVVKSGSYQYNMTVGAGVTFIIWDNDESFIKAVKKLISFFKELEKVGGDEIPEELVREGVELIVWFLIHINDIFTGDELFLLNPITW
ncbi:MAG: hypothetical protein ACFFA6_01980, partial [Promethearchaeota archaeon]